MDPCKEQIKELQKELQTQSQINKDLQGLLQEASLFKDMYANTE